MTIIGVTETVSKIKQIGEQARVAFIDREEFITGIEIAMISGLHAIVLGPPGTGKSKAIRYFAGAMGLPFFKKLLNPDLPREDLVGPLDPVKLQQGIWDRAWLGLATSPIVFIDEIGKGSAQVTNLLLDAMEERVASCADNERDIPLHTLISASNETISGESPAVWNRFSLRMVVRRIDNIRDFERFLKDSWKTDNPPSVPVKEEELIALRTACYKMASSAGNNTKLKRTLVKMFAEFPGMLHPSPRQWQNLLIAAAAHALLSGRTKIITSDLGVAGMMLWEDVDEIPDIKAWVKEIIAQEDREYSAAVEVLGRMTESLGNIEPSNIEALGTMSFRAKKLLAQIKEKVAETEEDQWADLQMSTEELVQAIETKGDIKPVF